VPLGFGPATDDLSLETSADFFPLG